MLMRWLIAISVAVALAGTVSACGKKPGNVDPPEGSKSDYPRTYPTSK